MKKIFFILFMFYSSWIFAQQVVSSAGSTMVNASGSISFTIGEGISQTISKGDNTLTQGFHQTTLSVSSINKIKDLDFIISVFPNPTHNWVSLKIGKENVAGLKIYLFNIDGKLISQKNIESNDTNVPFQNLNEGVYLLKISDGLHELKTFKIIKN